MEHLKATPEQEEGARRVQEAVARELALLAAEGVEPMILVAGASAAAAELVRQAFGPQHVGPLLRRQAQLAEELGWMKG